MSDETPSHRRRRSTSTRRRPYGEMGEETYCDKDTDGADRNADMLKRNTLRQENDIYRLNEVLHRLIKKA